MSNEDKLAKNKFSVKILGEKLTVTGSNISREYVEKLASYINEIGDEINNAYPQLPRRRILGLTLINLADELFKLQEKNNEIFQENKQLKAENEKLKQENVKLKNKINSLEEEYDELSILLEEVDD